MAGAAPRLTIVYGILLCATLVSYGTASHHGMADLGFALVILVAGLKGALIVRHFMEMRTAPREWRWAFDGLVLAAAAIIIGAHLLAPK